MGPDAEALPAGSAAARVHYPAEAGAASKQLQPAVIGIDSFANASRLAPLVSQPNEPLAESAKAEHALPSTEPRPQPARHPVRQFCADANSSSAENTNGWPRHDTDFPDVAVDLQPKSKQHWHSLAT